jgi:hypothetical protein
MDARVVAAAVVTGAFAVWGGWYAVRAFLTWSRLRGERIVICPETGEPATVHIDVALAVTGDAGSEPAALEACSRWPQRAECDQRCAASAQLANASPAALVKAWAKGQPCASCGGELTESRFTGHHVALLEPNGTTREWVDVAADRLALALATSLPVCWNCHVAATFRRTYPELVTDRDERANHVTEGGQ